MIYFLSLKEIICKDPGDVEFGTKQFYRRNYDEDYVEVGDKVEYSCYPNYKIEGSNYLTCTATGEWNREKPKCTGKSFRSFNN